MKASITCKQNCITVQSKKESETLYDTEIAPMIKRSSSFNDFVNAIYDYFTEELEDSEFSYKELQQICKKVYNSLHG